MRLNAPEVVIDLGGITSLRGIRDDGDAIVIGAMTTHHDVRDHALVKEHALLLSKAAAEVADSQIRHRGTFGGALAHADPAGDLGAPALALGAQFVIAGAGGTRTVEASDFFVDLFETAIGEDEILTEVRIPKHTGWGAHYEKFVRVAHQWPIVAIAATVKGSIDEARVGLTNMGSTPLRATRHRAGARRRHGHRGRRTRCRGAGVGGHQPALGPQRRRRLPPAPGARAHRPGRPEGRGGLRVELNHRFTVPIGVEETWAHFNDIASVAECFPGAQVTEADERSFAGSVKVKLGPIALQYNGSGTFVEKDEAAHRFVVDAKGKDKRGNGTAGAKVTVTMTDATGGATDVSVETDLAITGKPAQFGRGVMQDVSDKLLGQFVACLEQRLAAPEPDPEPDPEPAPAAPEAPVAAPQPGAHAAAPPPPPTPLRPPPPPPAPPTEALDLGSAVLPILAQHLLEARPGCSGGPAPAEAAAQALRRFRTRRAGGTARRCAARSGPPWAPSAPRCAGTSRPSPRGRRAPWSAPPTPRRRADAAAGGGGRRR